VLVGLTTKQNRDIPPLNYEVVHRLVKEFPDLQFVLNGGLTTFPSAVKHLSPCRFPDPCDKTNPVNPSVIGDDVYDSFNLSAAEYLPAVHGVMIGRAVYNNPLVSDMSWEP
jgi:tRNA-dihydrouridine synthase